MKWWWLLSLAVLQIPDGQSAIAEWNWERVLETTNKKNPELESSRASLRSAEFLSRGAFGGFFPDISGSLGYSYGTGGGTTGGTGGTSLSDLSDNATTRYTAALNVKENLFNGLSDQARLNQTDANAEVSRATYDATRARISYELKSAYAGLAYAQKAIALTDEIARRREANLKLVELRFQGGRENKGSLLLSRAYLEQARLEALQAGNSLVTARAQLARVMGMDENAEMLVLGLPPLMEPDPQTSFAGLVQATPDYRQFVAQEKVADANIDLARANFFPSLTVTGTTSSSGNTFFPKNDRWSVGATLTVPLFSGGKDYYATKSALELRKAAVLGKENAERVGLSKLRQSFATYREAVQRFRVDTDFAEAVLARARIAREKYNTGLLSFEDWDVIENDLIARQKSVLQSERDRVVGEAAWEQAQGKGAIR